ncbi:MAG: hypothetical protein Alpg2KO_12920 [Alphaproteobacteria bacterium]
MFDRIRLIPVLGVICLLAIGLRVADLASSHDFLTLSTAQAQEAEAPELAEEEQANPSDAPEEVSEAPVPSPTPRQPRGIDPSEYQFSASEIELLQTLGKRRAALEKRKAELDAREALLAAAESRFEQKRGELEALREEIKDFLRIHDEKQEEQLKSLVKTYETMKPKDAARIFDTLELDVLLEVVTRMKESRIAPVLANMDTKRAQTLTIKMAESGRLPGASMVDGQ